MNTLRTLACFLIGALLCSCGYRMGFPKSPKVGRNSTVCVKMFDNVSFYPMAGMQVSNAVADALQCDGTYKLAPLEKSDMVITGKMCSVTVSSIRTNSRDTYVSDEVKLSVRIKYRVTDRETGEVLLSGTVHGAARSANQLGNVQPARDDAVSWAVRQAAQNIVELMTTP